MVGAGPLTDQSPRRSRASELVKHIRIDESRFQTKFQLVYDSQRRKLHHLYIWACYIVNATQKEKKSNYHPNCSFQLRLETLVACVEDLIILCLKRLQWP